MPLLSVLQLFLLSFFQGLWNFGLLEKEKNKPLPHPLKNIHISLRDIHFL